jgi:hypothetical protein
MSFLIGELTEADRGDVGAWLDRQQLDLTGIATQPPCRTHDTDSVAVVEATFQPGPAAIPVKLTLYKDFGRVRVEATAPGPSQDAADRLARWLLDQLELRPVGSR